MKTREKKIHLIFEIIVNLFAKLLLLYKNININKNEKKIVTKKKDKPHTNLNIAQIWRVSNENS